MKRSGDGLVYSPADLIKFMESPFACWMDRFYLECPDQVTPDAVTEDGKLIADYGIKHEEQYLKSLVDSGKDVCQIDSRDPIESAELTRQAMAEQRGIIYQGYLSMPGFAGISDFLVLKNSGEGTPYYTVWDTKLARKPKPYFLVQLCCYAEMLEGIQGRRPDHVSVVLGTNEVNEFYVNRFFQFYRQLKAGFLKAMEAFDPNSLPDPDPSAQYYRWQSHAEKRLRESDHLSLVAGMGKAQIKKLAAVGINTVKELASSTVKEVPRMDSEILERVRDQARLQVETRRLRDAAKEGAVVLPSYKVLPAPTMGERLGFAILPPASKLDVFFDIEGFPLVDKGLEYLLGVSYREGGQLKFKDWWAHDLAQEKTAFEGFIDWVYDRWRRDPAMHIYHYAAYEVSAMRRLMGKHGTREDEVDALLRGEVFIDLYRVVNQGLRIGEENYSIKSVEALYRDKRSSEVKAAVQSVVYYANWVESDEPEDWESSPILKEIRDYNQDDCDSTVELAEWLRGIQQQHGIAYVAPSALEPRKRSDKASERFEGRQRLISDLEATLPESQKEREKDPGGWRIHELLHDLIEFHRREAKPVWWRLFDAEASSEEDLRLDLDCLSQVWRANREPEVVKRSLLFHYRFDSHEETKMSEGKTVKFIQNRGVDLTLFSIEASGDLALKISSKKLDDVLGGEMPGNGSLIQAEAISETD
jgi:predicted RecB family nuclease